MVTLHRRGRLPRGGVSLIELIVAVSIIAMLAGLTFTMVTIGNRAADNVTNLVSAVNPQAAQKRRVNVPPNGSQPIPNQYLVMFDAGVTNPHAEATKLAQTVPATVLAVYTSAVKGCAVTIQPGQLARLQAQPGVADVSPDQLGHLCAVLPTGVKRIRYVTAPTTPPFKLSFPIMPNFSAPITSSGGFINLPLAPQPGTVTTPLVKAVAVIDTGADASHPELNIVYQKGFGKGVPNTGDDVGHGTHVAGTIGARGIKLYGVFPGVPIWALRIFQPNASTYATSDLISALDFVVQNANQISAVNMSIGGPTDKMTNAAVNKCVAAGVVMCAAAGNALPGKAPVDASTLSPASASGAICVAALCDTDGLPGGKGAKGSFGDPDDTMTSFSNFGTTVTVMAPGEDIVSTFPVAQGSYASLSGTSMATPHTTGLCALLLTYSGEQAATGSTGNAFINLPSTGTGSLGGQPTVTTPAQVRAWLLTESVETIPGLAANKDTVSYHLITGRP